MNNDNVYLMTAIFVYFIVLRHFLVKLKKTVLYNIGCFTNRFNRFETIGDALI